MSARSPLAWRTARLSLLCTSAIICFSADALAKKVICIDGCNSAFVDNHEGWERANMGPGDVIQVGGNLQDCLNMLANGDTLVIVAHGWGSGQGFVWGGTQYTGLGGGAGQGANPHPVPAGFGTLMNITVSFCSCWSARDPDGMPGGDRPLTEKIVDAMGGAGNGHVANGFADLATASVCYTVTGPDRNAAIANLEATTAWLENPPTNSPGAMMTQETAAQAQLDMRFPPAGTYVVMITGYKQPVNMVAAPVGGGANGCECPGAAPFCGFGLQEGNPHPFATSTVFCSIAAEPTSDVPGFPGVKFAGTSLAFDRPFGTKNGHWILRTDTDAATTADAFLMVDYAVGAREGDAASFSGGNTIGPFEIRNGINESGKWAFKNNVAPTTTNDDYVVLVAGMTQTVIAQEGSVIGAFPPTVTWDDTITSVVLLDNDDVGMEGDGFDGTGITTNNDEAFVIESTGTDSILAQEGVTVPAGQLGGGTDAVENIDFEDVWYTPDGAHDVWKGDLLGLTTVDQVVVYDGTVVLQEGFDIPGGPYVGDPIDTTGIVEVAMDQAGNWWARGNNESETDWVVRNGVVMAKEGDPIFTGATELWDDATFTDLFFMHQGDSQGNYIIAGVTNASDINANAVLVLNHTTVVCRENDPLDLDNNGVFDDSAYVNTFGNDDLILNDLGELIFVCSIRSVPMGTTAVGQAVVKVQLFSAPTTYCTAGTTTNGCVPSISASGNPSVSFATSCLIAIANVEGQKNGIMFYGLAPNAVPWAFASNSFLCVKTPTQRTGTQSSGGTINACNGAMSLDWNAYQMANPTALGMPWSVGDNAYVQGWFRDPPAPKTTNLSDAIELTYLP